MNKRDFIKTLGTASAFTLLNPISTFGGQEKINKKVLMLGGRGLIGPSIVEAFLNTGCEVTLLNRGKTNPQLFKNLPIIICDRETENKQGLKAIDKKYKEQYWDIVVDTWQKSPKAVSDFLEEFKGQFGHFHYISTVSVYDKWDNKFIEETEPLNPLPKFPKTIGEDYRYAIRKTLAEEAIRERTTNYTMYRSHGMKDFRVSHPDDPNEEPFWPVRFLRGGEIVLPKVKDHHIQLTDIKSLTRFLVHCASKKIYGAFNVAHDPTPFKDYVSSLVHATDVPEKIHWVDGDFLIQNGLLPYKIVPLWKPSPAGSYYFNVQKAIHSGLVNRPMVEMITDQLNGYKSRHPRDDVRFGEVVNGKQLKYYAMDKEREVLKKWLSL
ncbi:NAD-dependent epimerase/dehydratase family protein [Flagellimonas sp. 389]|uniref:NAD-dependent epimerase/dehydratase family protein n=1 Tax=Flagellimonas sp. 389 TaxID=2835862 RepID=UPI001BD5B353|nr:NAD-dependent epimerase/dehydratase family protein [Flagellimonas sp. 389]MBS9461327.1 NAD-dependent epimerase/dehydratase family protein [Flagellimonas sp. 389]